MTTSAAIAADDLSVHLRRLSNYDLLARVKRLTGVERRTTVAILHHLNEIERRRLYLELGYSSLHDYCVQALDYSSSAAGRRIQAARCIRKCHRVLDLLQARELDLCTISLIESLLNGKDRDVILERVRGKSYREVKRVVSEYRPALAYPDRMEPVSVVTPDVGSEQKMFVQFLASEELMQKYEDAKGLLSHRHPQASFAEVLGVLLGEFLERHSPAARQKRREARKAAAAEGGKSSTAGADGDCQDGLRAHTGLAEETERVSATGPASRLAGSSRDPSRYIPAEVRDEVFVRDGARCTFVASNGTRCRATRALEIDHIQPWVAGGTNDPSNLRLLCAAHNRLAAERTLGFHVMERYWRRE